MNVDCLHRKQLIFVMAALVALLWSQTSQVWASALPVTSGLLFHVDASDTNSFGGSLPAENTPVATWYDTSGNHYNATQPTAGLQPIFKTNQYNGRPALVFDGSNDYLSLGTQLGKPNTYTVFVLAMTPNTARTESIFSSSDSGGSTRYSWVEVANLGSLPGQIEYGFGNDTLPGTAAYNYGHTTVPVLSNNIFRDIAETYMNGDAAVKIYADGVQQPTTNESGTGTSIGGTAAETAIGRYGGFNGSYWLGDISEIVVYNRVLSDSERLAVDAYLAGAAPVPEPASLSMFALGGLLLWRRKQAMQ
jgi:hypothetical protein